MRLGEDTVWESTSLFLGKHLGRNRRNRGICRLVYVFCYALPTTQHHKFSRVDTHELYCEYAATGVHN